MPKAPRGAMPLRDQIVARMTEEQAVQRMSDMGLAQRITKFYPMSAATVWKLKNSDPPRGLSIDEATAIARALGSNSIEEFLHDTPTLRAIKADLDSVLGEIYELEEAVEAHHIGLQLVMCLAALRGAEGENSVAPPRVNIEDRQEIEKRLDDIVVRAEKLSEKFNGIAAQTSRSATEIRDLLRQSQGELGRQGDGEE